MDLTNEDVADILALLDSLPYDELDVQTPRFRLTLRRSADGGWTQESRVLAEPNVVPAAPPSPGPAPATAASPPDPGLVAVAAPVPGTFYRAPRPGAAPFVEVGDEVTENTVVAIVETMKLMNPVHAGTRGKVAEICVANAESVTQGAALLRVARG